MRFLSILVLLSVTFVFNVITTSVYALTFTTNLTVGSTGIDVTTLQQTLVAQGYLVMPVGVTYGYFGSLTQSAVARWQIARGISPSVGYFGPISRATIATQNSPIVHTTSVSSSTIPTVVPTSPVPLPNIDTPSIPGIRANRIMLFRATPFEVRPGDPIMLNGSGFSKTLNKIYFNGGYEVIATSTNGTTMAVLVPSSLSEGQYNLSVSNSLGTSNSDNPNIIITIKVTNNPQQAPTINSVSLDGDTVTVIGSGFTSANNILTTFGNLSSPISANGDTITFRITDLRLYNKIKQSTLGRKYQSALWIYVKNEHGSNKDPYKLDITI